MNYSVSPRSLIAKLCILAMLTAFVIVLPVVRADVIANCDSCSNESTCNANHFAVDQWYADRDRCGPECDSDKANRDSQCEANKSGEEQTARDQCTDQQTGEIDKNCNNKRENEIQTEYFGCVEYSDWRWHGCLQYCDDRFQTPPEDCTCAYNSCPNRCCF